MVPTVKPNEIRNYNYAVSPPHFAGRNAYTHGSYIAPDEYLSDVSIPQKPLFLRGHDIAVGLLVATRNENAETGHLAVWDKKCWMFTTRRRHVMNSQYWRNEKYRWVSLWSARPQRSAYQYTNDECDPHHSVPNRIHWNLSCQTVRIIFQYKQFLVEIFSLCSSYLLKFSGVIVNLIESKWSLQKKLC